MELGRSTFIDDVDVDLDVDFDVDDVDGDDDACYVLIDGDEDYVGWLN